MDDIKAPWTTVLIVCAVIGLLSALATRKVFVGFGIMVALFLAWGMWKYIKDVTKEG
jgi:hypothetical protein